MGAWNVRAAAKALSLKESQVADAGERFGRPWALTVDGAEYVLDGGILKIYSRRLSEAERLGGKTEPTYDGMAIPRFVPTASEMVTQTGVDNPPPEEPAKPGAADGDPADTFDPEWTKAQLREWAAERDIETDSKANKADLIAFIEEALTSAGDTKGDGDGN